MKERSGMRNQFIILFQFCAGVGMILVGVVGEAVWFSWRVQHGGRQSLLMQAIPLGTLYILNGVTILLAGRQESNTVKQGVAMVMNLLSAVAALYILCITADLVALERFNIKQHINDNNTVSSSIKTYLMVLACVVLLSLVEILLTLYMAKTFHHRVSKWHQKFVDRITSNPAKQSSIYIAPTPHYEKLATIPDADAEDDGVIVLPGTSASQI